MDKKSKKIYFHAEEYVAGDLSGIRFIGENGMTGYWAGGNEHKAKFILQKLTDTHGIELGVQIYNAYNNALLDVSKDKQRKDKKAVLVFYVRKNDNQGESGNGTMVKNKEDIYGGEQGPMKTAEGSKKAASATEVYKSIF